jgi:glycosyltransferase involved in cell wall biosynthesis
MPKLVMMLRVKDGIFFVHEWLACYEKLVDEIIALDNGSTDGTYEALKAHPKVVDVLRTEGYNEGRDKNLLYEHVRKRKPDWCIWLDVDEIFEPGLTRKHLDKLMQSKLITRYAFRRFHFIDREHFAGSWFRLNYSSGHDRIMWLEQPSGYFEDKILDSPNVKGIKGIKMPTNFRLKHLGYIDKDLVDKKAEIYRGITTDIETTLQEMYLKNERPIKWIDNRNSMKVILLNHFLTCIQVKNMVPKVISRVSKLLSRRSEAQNSATVTAN